MRTQLTLAALCLALTIGLADHALAEPNPQPVSVTYECHGNLKAYARRVLFDGAAHSPGGDGFSVSAYPRTENSELAVLNAAGAPEYLIHPALVECGCFLDDQIFVTHFSAKGPSHYNRLSGQFRFALEDGSGSLDCKIALSPPQSELGEW